MESLPEKQSELTSEERFMRANLTMMAEKLLHVTYPGYPGPEDRFYIPHLDEMAFDQFLDTSKPWWVTKPDPGEDLGSLELHPWFDRMATMKSIGVVAGKGFYWSYGANSTADPIIFRYDLDEPYVRLVVRGDTGQLAFPGGFVEKGEDPVNAARREAMEESFVDLSEVDGKLVYEGVVADIRTTAHAWPETTAVQFDLPKHLTKGLPTDITKGGDDARETGWFPVTKARESMFGSHGLLLRQALGEDV